MIVSLQMCDVYSNIEQLGIYFKELFYTGK